MRDPEDGDRDRPDVRPVTGATVGLVGGRLGEGRAEDKGLQAWSHTDVILYSRGQDFKF